MRRERAALRSAVDSVADGAGDVDWDALEEQVEGQHDWELIHHLRLLAQISDVQRSQSDILDDDSLETWAKAIARMVPAADSARHSVVRADAARALSQIAGANLAETSPERLWGRLELRELLGKGRFGEVYRAFDRKLEREVAVKLLHVDTPQQRLIERTLREARILARDPPYERRGRARCGAARWPRWPVHGVHPRSHARARARCSGDAQPLRGNAGGPRSLPRAGGGPQGGAGPPRHQVPERDARRGRACRPMDFGAAQCAPLIRRARRASPARLSIWHPQLLKGERPRFEATSTVWAF